MALPSSALANISWSLGIASAGTYRAAVVMLVYITPLSTLVSSEVMAATFSFAVLPPLKATVISSPTLTPCALA